jgi:hypothetical protein
MGAYLLAVLWCRMRGTHKGHIVFVDPVGDRSLHDRAYWLCDRCGAIVRGGDHG